MMSSRKFDGFLSEASVPLNEGEDIINDVLDIAKSGMRNTAKIESI